MVLYLERLAGGTCVIDKSLNLLQESFSVFIVLMADDEISRSNGFLFAKLIFVQSCKPKHNEIRIITAFLIPYHRDFQTNQVLLD